MILSGENYNKVHEFLENSLVHPMIIKFNRKVHYHLKMQFDSPINISICQRTK